MSFLSYFLSKVYIPHNFKAGKAPTVTFCIETPWDETKRPNMLRASVSTSVSFFMELNEASVHQLKHRPNVFRHVYVCNLYRYKEKLLGLKPCDKIYRHFLLGVGWCFSVNLGFQIEIITAVNEDNFLVSTEARPLIYHYTLKDHHDIDAFQKL